MPRNTKSASKLRENHELPNGGVIDISEDGAEQSYAQQVWDSFLRDETLGDLNRVLGLPREFRFANGQILEDIAYDSFQDYFWKNLSPHGASSLALPVDFIDSFKKDIIDELSERSYLSKFGVKENSAAKKECKCGKACKCKGKKVAEKVMFVDGLTAYSAQGKLLLRNFNSMREALEFAGRQNYTEVVDTKSARRYTVIMETSDSVTLRCVWITTPRADGGRIAKVFTEGKDYVARQVTDRSFEFQDDLGITRSIVIEDGKGRFLIGHNPNILGTDPALFAEFEVVTPYNNQVTVDRRIARIATKYDAERRRPSVGGHAPYPKGSRAAKWIGEGQENDPTQGKVALYLCYIGDGYLYGATDNESASRPGYWMAGEPVTITQATFDAADAQKLLDYSNDNVAGFSDGYEAAEFAQRGKQEHVVYEDEDEEPTLAESTSEFQKPLKEDAWAMRESAPAPAPALKEGSFEDGMWQEVVEHVSKTLTPEVRQARASAIQNLHYGPSGGGDGPGWESALAILRDWADHNVTDLYYDSQSGVISDTEPQGFEEEGEFVEPGDYYLLEARDIVRKVLGGIAQYVY